MSTTRCLFQANDGATGFELWKSDVTTAGTTLVRNIFPGTIAPNPQQLTNVNGRLYFAATGSSGGRELFTSDGTTSGTVSIKEIRPGLDGSYPDNLANIHGTLFFAADNGVNGVELWVLSNPESAPSPTGMPGVDARPLAGDSVPNGARWGWSIRPLNELPRMPEMIAFRSGTYPGVESSAADGGGINSNGASSPIPRRALISAAYAHRHVDSAPRSAAPRAMWTSRIDSTKAQEQSTVLDRIIAEKVF